MPRSHIASVCAVGNCDKAAYKMGLCNAHYIRKRRHGDPLAGRVPNGVPKRYLLEVVIPFDEDACLIWPYGKTNKYPSISVDGTTRPVIGIVCEARWGPAPSPQHEVAHKCGVRACCAPRHLRWATVLENAQDRIIHGTVLRGEMVPNSKLSADDVRIIRSLKGTMSEPKIAALFNVSRGAVNHIFRGNSWSWLKD